MKLTIQNFCNNNSIQITKDIFSYQHNIGNNIHIDRCYWYIFRKCIQLKQTTNLYKFLSKILSKLRKTALQDTKKLIQIKTSKKALE